MDSISYSIGDILTIQNKRNRILYIDHISVVICQMDISFINICDFSPEFISNGILDKTVGYQKSDDCSVVDIDTISDSSRKLYERNRAMMNEIDHLFGPCYFGILERANAATLNELMLKYKIKRTAFWDVCRHYLQSGLRDSSLARCRNNSLKHETNDKRKRGETGKYGISTTFVVDCEAKEIFAEMLEYYKSGRAKSIRKAYDKMNMEYFSTVEFKDGTYSRLLLPLTQRPSFRQFSYYCHNHLPAEEKDIVKSNRMEQRNKKRLLLGEDANRVTSPGEKVEIDAVEVDLSLVSVIDPNQTVGRPIVYAMRDVLTHAIVAISVAFDNNSLLGLTSLMLNLGDDKAEYCRRYGIELEDLRLWPSNFIPANLYADRGSDFRSDEFGRICNELGIDRHLVPGGSGSMKGMIEQWFHQMHTMINAHTEKHGLIEKRYDSKHHKEATLNINQFTTILISCVLSYNQSHMDGYHPRADEIRDGIDATPAYLWEYRCKTDGAPRPISSRLDYFYKLLFKARAKIGKRGIEFKGLTYINPEDKDLYNKMYLQQTKKAPFDIRYDPRDNSKIYYIKDGILMIAKLNLSIAWMSDLEGLSFKETEEYFRLKRRGGIEARQRNDQIRADRFSVIENVLDTAKKEHKGNSNDKNMRSAREVEKQMVAKSNRIETRFIQEGLIPADSPEAVIPSEDNLIKGKAATEFAISDDTFFSALEEY